MPTLKETLADLLALQQIDREILRAKRAQTALDNGTTATATATAARAAYESKNTAHHKAMGDLKDCELKLSGLETKLKSYEQKLYQGTVTNPKELSNIEKEIAALHRQRSDLDGSILELMDSVEQKGTGSNIAEAEYKAADLARASAIEQFRANYERLSQELKELSQKRVDAQGKIQDPQLLKRYDDIRARGGGIGLVQINNRNCGGCSMTLPTAQIKLVKDADTVVQFCENCGRILAP